MRELAHRCPRSSKELPPLAARLCASLRVLAPLVFLLPVCPSVASARGGEFVPAGSEVGALRPGQSLHLLSALEVGSFVKPGGWHMEQFAVEKADAPAKLGRDALTFRGTSAEAAKGDFDIGGPLPGEALAVGCWFHLTEGANVREVGFQFYDNEGEALLYLVPANWTGWKWVETLMTAAALVAFVAGLESSYINGANLTVDGGVNA